MARTTTKLSEIEETTIQMYKDGMSYDEICANTKLAYRPAVGAVTRARNKLRLLGIEVPNNEPKKIERESHQKKWNPEYLRGITEFCVACKSVAAVHNDGYYCAKDGTRRDWDTPGCNTWSEGST